MKRLPLALLAVTLCGATASLTFAQTTKPSPAAPAKPVASSATKLRTVTLAPSRPGTYSYWIVTMSGKGTVGQIAPGATPPNLSLPVDATLVELLDETNGLVARLPLDKVKDGATLKVSADAFNRVRSLTVKVVGAAAKPVKSAVVTLTDATGTVVERVVTEAEVGQAKFENVPVGKATVAAAYGPNASEKAAQETSITPGKGGAPAEVTLTLSDSVPTLDKPMPTTGDAPTTQTAGGNAPTVIVQQPAQTPQPERNDWVSGLIGIAIVGGGAFYFMRYAKARGMTVAQALKSMGAEMPQDAQAGSMSGLKPAPVSLPPLASLNDMPAGSAASAPVTGFGRPPVASTGAPRLVGVDGSVAGQTFDLDKAIPLTVGREADNTLALLNDKTLSRHHARFVSSTTGFEVVDDGSSNGTYVNGQRTSRQTLLPGDEVQIGSARFRYEA